MATGSGSCRWAPHTWPPPETAVPRFGITPETPERERVYREIGAWAGLLAIVSIGGILLLGIPGLLLGGGLFVYLLLRSLLQLTVPPDFNAYARASPQVPPDGPDGSLLPWLQQAREEQLSSLWDVVDFPQDRPSADCDDPLSDAYCVDCAGGCQSCGTTGSSCGGDGGNSGGDGGSSGGGCGA